MNVRALGDAEYNDQCRLQGVKEGEICQEIDIFRGA